MTQPADRPSPAQSPLATPMPWDLVSAAYAQEILPGFTPFAEEALRLAGVGQGTRVLDVACGPGTLALLAARRGAEVDALDFSPGMVAQLRAAAERESLTRLRVREGDGQNLPFADGGHDAAFSMFGLMFFPDRGRGFAELRRCLVDGGVAVVSSWQPMEANVPFLAALFTALRDQMPDLPFGNAEAPLAVAERFREEMSAAGFRDVEVREHRGQFDYPSLAAGWQSLERTLAPLAMLIRKLGPAWPPMGQAIERRLAAQFGEGPQTMVMPAWLGMGRR